MNAIRKLINLLPKSIKVKILRTWRLRSLWINKLRSRISSSKSINRYLSEDTVYWVDPQKIVFAMNSEGLNLAAQAHENSLNYEFDHYEYRGRVIGGNWDRLERKFSELDFYKSYKERALKGTSWEQLPYYRRVLEQIKNGKEKWDCKSKQDLDERCRKLDRIFSDIKHNGYKSRVQQEKENNEADLLDEEDEINVHIGRHGDLIFGDGRHRLTFAKILGIEKVPVTIAVRHSEWEEFKKEVEAYIKKNNGRVYAPLTHIDLNYINTDYGHDTYELIRKNIGGSNSTLLDIGASWGYFCHKFDDDGFRCTAVEVDQESLYFLKELRISQNVRFEVISESINTLSKRIPLKYDIVLCLTGINRFFTENASVVDLKCLLQNLDVNELYFASPLDNSSQIGGEFINFSPEKYLEFILSNSCLNRYKLIGKSEDDSDIYKFWR